MGKQSVIQPSFNAGELSPRLEGRVDLAKYKNGCRIMENVLPLVQGGALKRSGTRYVKDCHHPNNETFNSRIIPFEFGRDQAYVLEFCHNVIRVFRNFSGVPKVITEAAVTISSNDAADPCTITTAAAHGYVVGNEVFIEGTGEFQLDDRFFDVASVPSTTTFTVDTLSAPSANTGGTAKRSHEITTTYSGNPALPSSSEHIDYAQSADVLYLAHPTVPPQEITRVADNEWKISEIVFDHRPFRPLNIEDRKTAQCSHNDGTGRTLTAMGFTMTSVSNASPAVITFPASPAHTFKVDDRVSLYGVGGDATVLGLVNNNTFDVTAVTSTTATIDLDASSGGGNGTAGTCAYALFEDLAVDDHFKLGEIVESVNGLWEPASINTRYAGLALDDLRYFEGNVYQLKTAPGSGSSGTSAPVHEEGTVSDGRWDWLFLHAGDGYVQLKTRTNDALWTVDVIKYVPDTAIGTALSGNLTSRWALDAWTSEFGYPESVTFFEDRLWWGGTTKDPQTFWASRSGSYKDHRIIQLDESALIFTLNTDQVNVIEWMSPGKVLQLGTASSEFVVSGATESEALVPGNVRVVRHSTFGSKTSLAPVRVDNVLLFVQRAGRKVRELVFDDASQDYLAPDMTVLAEHLTLKGIKRMTFQQEPNKLVWCALDNGELVCLTYERDQQVVAWHQHRLGGYYNFGQSGTMVSGSTTVALSDTSDMRPGMPISAAGGSIPAGAYIVRVIDSRDVEISSAATGNTTATVTVKQHPKVLSVAAISVPTESRDELWLTVRRTVNGLAVQVLEVMQEDFLRTTAIDKGWFVDSGLTYDGADVGFLDGFDHLEGETLQVLGDGKKQADQMVSSGRITISPAAGRVQAGLAYTATLQQMRPEAGSRDGTSQGKFGRVTNVTFRLDQTGKGLFFGPDDDPTPTLSSMNEVPITAGELFSGDTEFLPFPEGYEQERRVTMKHNAPLPWGLTAIMSSLHAEDR